MLISCVYLLIHCYLFTPALILLGLPFMCLVQECRGRGLVAHALALAEEERHIVQLRESAPSGVVVTGVVIATEAPSAQATLISSEGAVMYDVMYETAPAVVIRGPL